LTTNVPVLDVGLLHDRPGDSVVTQSQVSFSGYVWNVVTDDVVLSNGDVVQRDVVRHPGAVAVIALDEDGHVVLVEQYRHPMMSRMWEAPAGLRDVDGEPALVTAQRELAEEAGLQAEQWTPLLELALTPGGSDEIISVFLAEKLSACEVVDFVPEGEEADIVVGRFPLQEVIEAVLAGRIRNATLACAVLALGLRNPR
jgi:8-oxo-dGTP pyrophosphatase MutT (NUDIX family)